MAHKNRISLFGILRNVVQGYAHYLVELAEVASLEAKLAVSTLLLLIFLILILALLLFGTWALILLMLFQYLITISISPLTATFILLLINLLLLCFIFIYVNMLKKNLFFPETREQIHHVRRLVGKD